MTEQAPVAPVEGQADGQAQAWYSQYEFKPEDVGYIQNKGWDNPAKVIESYKGLEKFHGVPAEQLLKLPKDGEDMSPVYTRLGRPESADKYEVKPVEGVTFDDNRLNWAKGVAHNLGINQKQFETLINETAKYEGGFVQEQMQAVQQQQEAELNDLKKEWGAHYGEREHLAKQAVRSFLPANENEKAELLDKIEGAIGTARMLKLFANIGQNIGEDKIHQSSTGSRPFGYTKEQAMSEKQQLMAELSGDNTRLNVYNEAKGSDYEKMNRLNKIIAGAE